MLFFVSASLPLPRFKDGATIRVYEILTRLMRVEPVVFIYYGFKPPIDELNKSKAFIESSGSFFFYIFIEGFLDRTLHTIGIPRKKQALDKLKHLMRLRPFPSCIWFEGLYTSPMLYFFSSFSQSAKILSAVDCLSLASLRQFSIPNQSVFQRSRHLARFLVRFIVESWYFRKFSLTSFVSDDDAKFARRIFNRLYHVIPNGVDVEYFSPGAAGFDSRDTSDNGTKYPFEMRAGFTGVLSSSMNIAAARYLIELSSESPISSLVIAGLNPAAQLHEEAATNPKVELVDSPTDLRPILANIDLFICPIFYGTGIKNNVLQAMSMGLVCLVTPLIADPIGIVHGKNGLIFSNRAELLAILSNIHDFDHLAISLEARKTVERAFSWESVITSHLDHP